MIHFGAKHSSMLAIPHGLMLTTNMRLTSGGVGPYKTDLGRGKGRQDRFNMETVVEVSPDTRAGARGVRLARRCGVHFVRRLPSLLESFVTYSVVETSRAGACAWRELVDEAIALETAQRDARSALAARPALAAALDARDDRADSADGADGADGDDGGATPRAAADPFCGARSTRWSCGGAAGRFCGHDS